MSRGDLPSRRAMLGRLAAVGAGAGWAAAGGCGLAARANAGRLEKVWGYRGNRPGRLQKPRAIAADDRDRLYIADCTDRIQVFDLDGRFIDCWRLPAFDIDGSTGISIDGRGLLLIADTHFYRILIYEPVGKELLAVIGGVQGDGLGQFAYVRDVVRGPAGYLYCCEYGEAVQRVQVIGPDYRFVRQWGSPGTAPGQFARPEALAFDRQGRLFVADTCNHRIQVFEASGRLVDCWGRPGSRLGELFYPCDIAFGPDGSLYVCEQCNHRVQKFRPDGRTLGAWGGPGRRPGRLNFPWGLTVDRYGRVHVADSGNHRVQRIVL